MWWKETFAGDCWAMAIFKTGEEDKSPVEFRVRELSAITLMKEPDGKLAAHLEDKAIVSAARAA